MRILQIALITKMLHQPSSHIFMESGRTNNINPTIFINKKKRETAMGFNRHKNNDIFRCYFCMGAGYVPCQLCYKPACYKCDNTDYEECRICRGSGRGGPGSHDIDLLCESPIGNLAKLNKY